ncbi:hypothetical protein ACX1C1_05265 [Paenibacillus sp. strain BS8-2]
MMQQAIRHPACPLCHSADYERLQEKRQELHRLQAIINDNQRLRRLSIKECSGIIDRIHELRQECGEIYTRL